MTPDDRLACFVEVMQLAHAILEGRPDARDVLARVEPLSPQAEALWLRLVRESRARTVG